MNEPEPGMVTRIVRSIEAGDATAADQLLPIIYDELRRVGHAMMARVPPGNTLQGTALVHEAYVRLLAEDDPDWKSRTYFFAAAARAMRRILVEQARRKAAIKYGGGKKRVDADAVDLPIEPPTHDMLTLDQCLEKLREQDPRKADVVELRFFAGLSIAETAELLGVSEPTVERDWRFSRAFLYDQMAEPGEE
jgi:RNA polymerase sigma factor (TIGR02999 family)